MLRKVKMMIIQNCLSCKSKTCQDIDSLDVMTQIRNMKMISKLKAWIDGDGEIFLVMRKRQKGGIVGKSLFQATELKLTAGNPVKPVPKSQRSQL